MFIVKLHIQSLLNVNCLINDHAIIHLYIYKNVLINPELVEGHNAI